MALKEINNIINKYIPNQYRGQFNSALQAGDKAIQGLVRSVATTPIGAVVSQFKPIYESVTRELEPNTVSAASSYDMLLADIQSNLRNLGRSDEIGERARQDLVMSIIALVPGMETKTAQGIVNAAKGMSAKNAANYVMNKTIEARQGLVRQSTKAQQAIKSGSESLQKTIDDAVLKARAKLNPYKDEPITLEQYFDDALNLTDPAKLSREDFRFIFGDKNRKISGLSKEGRETLKDYIKKNADAFGRVAEEVGVKSPKDLPRLMGFVKQMGDILRNSPKYIYSQATGHPFVSAITTGVSLYDLYQSYKENGDSLIPKGVGAATAFGASTLPGPPLLKLFYAGLGYTGGQFGTNLVRSAWRKLLGNNQEQQDTIYQREEKQGIRRTGLSEQLPEYLEGQSGRKYHIVNDKIYDFSTGKPVNIDSALSDVNDYVNFQRQQVEDRLKANREEQIQIENYRQAGYNITPDMLEPIYTEEDALLTELGDLNQQSRALNQPQYDPDGDLVEQYYRQEVEPIQQQQAAQAAEEQQNFQDTYNTVYSKIAQDTFADLDNYINMDALTSAYYQNQAAAMRGEAISLTPDEFVRQTKLQYMLQLTPQIQKNAMDYISSVQSARAQARELALKERAQSETERYNRARNMLDLMGVQETQRSNIAQEKLGQYKAQSGRMSSLADLQNAASRRGELGVSQGRLAVSQRQADIAAQNAETASRRADIDEAMIPYNQARTISEAVGNVGMQQEVPFDTFLNTNQSVMKQVFPAAFQNNQQTPTDQNIQNINQYYNTRSGQFQQGR